MLAGCATRTPYGANLADIPQAPGAPSSIAAATKLIFHDEFSGTSLNTKIWYPCYNWANEYRGCKTGPGELEVYQPGNVTVAGGYLNLTAKHETKKYRAKPTTSHPASFKPAALPRTAARRPSRTNTATAKSAQNSRRVTSACGPRFGYSRPTIAGRPKSTSWNGKASRRLKTK